MYFVIFDRCGEVAVNKIYRSMPFLGIRVVWGLIIMVMVYSVGHVSGAHFNHVVTPPSPFFVASSSGRFVHGCLIKTITKQAKNVDSES
ncbi:putative aquaporin NIP-type [Cucumis melo var. makuwa]|uniref:Putative aquaporin NIP-type n=1 Tax=Cucumis melo var. makuwa TaxID=1194695 RepID=A0A5D3C9R1_CUCMM|nr:putative aquaporin NIP-type [Cucumis melo var. makuwa]